MSKKAELKIHGFNACLAVFKRRPEGLVRVYLTEARMKTLSDVVRHCVKNRLAYHVSSPAELEKVSGATHHEGVCFVIKLPPFPDARELTRMAGQPGQWLAIEDVGNPHNLGAIMRTAAHFGAKGVFLVAPQGSWETGAYYRTAEGGAEVVPVIPVETLPELVALTAELGLTLYATSGNQGASLYKGKLADKAVFFMGAEGPGLSVEALKASTKTLRIPGTELVESLNVAAATALFMGEWYRQHAP